MYSLSREQKQPQAPLGPVDPVPVAETQRAKTDDPAVDQFNHHIMLTVRAVNNLRSVFVVRGS